MPFFLLFLYKGWQNVGQNGPGHVVRDKSWGPFIFGINILLLNLLLLYMDIRARTSLIPRKHRLVVLNVTGNQVYH